MKKIWYFLFGSETSYGLFPGLWVETTGAIKRAWANAVWSVKDL
jgi:hypothetical protein